MPDAKPCSHLVADGQYRELCENLIPKYPNLRHKDFKHKWADNSLVAGTSSKFRLVSIDLSCVPPRIDNIVTSFSEVEAYLQHAPQTTPSRRLYIIEGLNPDVFALVGDKLQVDPRVLMRHQRTALYDSEHDGGNAPSLASLINPNCTYTLEFYEPRYFSGGFDNVSLVCADSRRHVAVPGKDGRFENIGVICNKASFWARSSTNGGWQALMMVDPPPNSFLHAGSDGVVRSQIINLPYQGGYADFVPYTDVDAMKSKPAPPRTSMFDDLCHYFAHHSDLLKLDSAPSSADLFLRKLVASQYIQLGQYCGGLLSHLEWRMSRQHSLESLTVSLLQEQWNELQLFHRRTDDYLHAITQIVRSLQLSKGQTQVGDWRSSRADFEDIRDRFDALVRKSECLVASFGGLAGIISSRESLREASTVGKLTILGMVFLPLSFVTGLFSMAQEYLPGNEHFGYYWAVSVPLVLLILFVPYLMMLARRKSKAHFEKSRFVEYRYWESKQGT